MRGLILLGCVQLAACQDFRISDPGKDLPTQPDTDTDGAVDTGDPAIDTEGTGTPDPPEDDCNGVDDDGDGVVDDGFADSDTDCAPPPELCNGVDDDGDGDIDEDFMVDDQGEPRCCEEAPFVVTYASDRRIQVRTSKGDGTLNDPVVLYGAGTAVRGAVDVDHDRGSPYQLVVVDDAGDRRIAACERGGWVEETHGTHEGRGATWGDLDGDGCVDFVGYDYGAGPFGRVGTGLGETWRGDCAGGFSQASSSWDVLFLDGLWSGGPPARLADWTGAGGPDLLLWAVQSGGSSTSEAWALPGGPSGALLEEVAFGNDLPQAGGRGDLGDVDGNGTIDWVLGANDDGNPGAALVILGDGTGGVTSTHPVGDGCAGTTGCYGDGTAVLIDLDGDGALDVVQTVTDGVGSSAVRSRLLVWTNKDDGTGTFDGPTEVESDFVLGSQTIFASFPPSRPMP